MSHSPDNSGWLILWRMVRKQRQLLCCSLFFALSAAVMELVPFWIIFTAMEAVLNDYRDLISASQLSSALYLSALWLLAALFIKTLVYMGAYALSHQAAFRILTYTRRLLVTRLAWAPVHWLQKYHSGQLKLAVLQDVDRVENFVAHHTVEVTVSLVGPLLVTVYLLCIDWRLALAALLVAPLAVLSSLLVMRGMNRLYDDYHQASVSLNSTTVEYLRNMPVMKLFQQDSSRFKTMVLSLEQYYAIVEKMTKVTVPRWALFTSLLSANLLVILPVSIHLYEIDEVRLLDILMAVLLGAGMLRPLLKVSHFFTEIKEVLAGIKRLQPILDVEDTQQTTFAERISSPFTVTFDDVHFQYGELSVLNGVNLNLSSGTTTVLLGVSGGGKSTLAQILAGLLLPTKGQVHINGIAVLQLGNKQRAALIAVASQDVFLFKGSIRDNLMLARDGVAEQEMHLAIRVAQAEELIAQLPDGYETQLEEQGLRLSGGEKQRIALARALLADTPILVLDEATAFADSLTQKAFYRELKLCFPHKTVLVIAHRTYGLENVDQVVILDNGRIQATGTHHALLEQNQYYQQLWELQSNGENWSIASANTEKEVMGVKCDG